MWISLDSQSVRRCSKSVLPCSFPYVDDGFEGCELPAPVITRIHIEQASGAATQVDDLNVLNVSPRDFDLLVEGQWFSHPLRVLVGGVVCDEPLLLDVGVNGSSVVCANISRAGNSSACNEFGSALSCSIPNQLFGYNLAVTVLSGLYAQMAFPRHSVETPRISSSGPVLDWLKSSACQQDDNNPRVLTGCAVESAFNLTVCLDADSLFQSEESGGLCQIPLPTSVFLSSPQPLLCSGWDFSPEIPCGNWCGNCLVHPQLGQRLVVRARQQLLDSREPASISFLPCPAGTVTDFEAAASGSADTICRACPAGHSTSNGTGQAECQRCLPGSFASSPRQAACQYCPRGSYMPDAGATACQPCPSNSWQQHEGQTRCDVCDLDSYIQYGNDSRPQPGSTRTSGHCLACPALTSCDPNGNITAMQGSFLVVDQQEASVSRVVCSQSACIDWSDGCAGSSASLVISASQLHVRTCCGTGRLASIGSGSPLLQSTHDINVLCAYCLPDHSLVNGRCIPCEGVHWDLLLGLLLLALVLVYLLHRVPMGSSDSAKLFIALYLLQMSAVFLAAESLPHLLSIVNVNLLGDQLTRGAQHNADSGAPYIGSCIVPLSDFGRIGMTLFSPIIAFCLLGLLLLLDLAAQSVLRLAQPSQSSLAFKAYFLVFPMSGGHPAAPSPSISDSLAQPLVDAALDERTEEAESRPLDAETMAVRCDSLRYQHTVVRLAALLHVRLADDAVLLQLRVARRVGTAPGGLPADRSRQQLVPNATARRGSAAGGIRLRPAGGAGRVPAPRASTRQAAGRSGAQPGSRCPDLAAGGHVPACLLVVGCGAAAATARAGGAAGAGGRRLGLALAVGRQLAAARRPSPPLALPSSRGQRAGGAGARLARSPDLRAGAMAAALHDERTASHAPHAGAGSTHRAAHRRPRATLRSTLEEGPRPA